MDAAKQSPLSSFKSTKHLHSPAPSDQKTRKVSDLNPNSLTIKTPGKPADPPRRSRHRGAALSMNEIRQEALRIQKRGSNPPERTDPVFGSEEEHIAKPKKFVAAEIKLPEKYELLDKFFNSLDSSIRLLQLKRSATTFTNISSQVQCLTDRRFTYSHLAQLKYIMPEAIVLEKVLQRDERTCCMKPDLRITLDFEAIESKSKSKSKSGNLLLRKVFRGRLLNFFKSHPEVDEIPEEVLPEPFSRFEDSSAYSTQPSCASFVRETRDMAFSHLPVTGSHLPPSFRRSFSQRSSGHQTEKFKQDGSVFSAHSSVDSEDKFAPSGKGTSEIAGYTHSKLSLKPSGREIFSSSEASLCTELVSPYPETPVKSVDSIKDEGECYDGMNPLLKTPVDIASTPVKLMSATPMLQPPKRCYMSPDDNSFRSPSKLVRRPPPNRPLKFDTPVKSSNVDDHKCGQSGSSSTGSEIFYILPESLIQSIQEKERLALMEKEPAISQARWRQKMIACLPKLFDMIYFYFQSIRLSVVTKEELTQKLVAHSDVVDRKEVEEQLRLLQELAPEWIYEKSSLSGDLLICVNKISSPRVIRTRLYEAK